MVVSYKALKGEDLLASGIKTDIEVLDLVRRIRERFSAFFEDNGIGYNVIKAAGGTES